MAQAAEFVVANAAFAASRPEGQLPMPPARKVAVVVRQRFSGSGDAGSLLWPVALTHTRVRAPARVRPHDQVCMDARILPSHVLGLKEGCVL
jgi:hypothetical protein